ncbi:MAG: SGNH/GDSL hydrolase family protein [Opitutaceae bacterium]|jgi:lysophospholipase L1-like esterase
MPKLPVCFLALAASCLLPCARAEIAFVANAAQPMSAHAPQKTGAAFAIVEAPAGAFATKAGRAGWTDAHTGFLEYYYAADIALPAGETPQGRLVLRVWADQPASFWALGVRVKTPDGQIFHFDAKTGLVGGRWEDVAIEIKQGASKSNWGGSQSGRLAGPLLLTGVSLLVNPEAAAGGLLIDRISWEGVAGPAQDAAKPGAPRLSATDVAPNDLVYPLAEAHLFAPHWRSSVIHGESVLLLKESGQDAATGTLLASPAKVLRVRSSDGKTEYAPGTDYMIDAGRRRIVLTPGSRIPFFEEADLYKKKGEPRAIPAKLGNPETYLLYVERGFPAKQVEIDYEPSGGWTGRTPAFAATSLNSTVAKLRKCERVVIAVTGDSITAGANASKNVPPFQPAFPALLQRGLKQAYGGPVLLANLGKAGATAEDGVANIDALSGLRPDLVIVAYGMNDTAGKDPLAYQSRIRRIVEGVRAASPATEFILVSSSLANPEWNWSQASQFAPYRDALQALTGPGVVLADATALWGDLLKNKRYLDLTGNGVNHPNDFGHRLYAQMLLSLLVDPALPPEQDQGGR